MKIALTLTVNAEDQTALADTRDTLLEFLRDRLGLTGTKEGCGNGNCGACTVLMDGAPVCACLVLAREAEGCAVTTIESLGSGLGSGSGRLHPIQEALIAHGGTQCGFCTPGIVLTAKALLDATPAPTDAEIRAAIAGNLCRCTGYDRIVRAIGAAAETLRKGA